MSAMRDDEVDSEIADIFIEEAVEVLENIDKYLPILKDRPADRGALVEVRRGFHTLKGSGRMVNALDLGELAWKIENMLNRAMDGTVKVSAQMVTLVAASRKAMPRLLEAFKRGKQGIMDTELESLIHQVDAVANGQPLKTVAPSPSPTPVLAPAAQDFQVKIDALDRRFARQSQRADEALQRAEMALQQVRRLAAQVRNVEMDTQERVSREDFAQIDDRVQMLSQELLEMRQVAEGFARQGTPQPRELQRVIDRRVGDKLAPVERLQSAVQQQLDDNRLAVSSARRLAVTAMILSLLFAGAAAGMFFFLAGPTVP